MLIGEFSDLQWTAMLVIGMGAGLIHGFVGIGFPLIATPLFALLFGFQRAVPILVLHDEEDEVVLDAHARLVV